MNAKLQSTLLRFGCAVGSVGVMTFIRLALDPWIREKAAFQLYLPAVMASAFYGGLGSGLLATLLGGILGATVISPSRFDLLASSSDYIALVLYVIVSLVITLLSVTQRKAKQCAELNAELLEEKQEVLRKEISERKRVEEQREELLGRLEVEQGRLTEALRALAESEAQYRLIGESIPYGVWICEADGQIRYLSQSFLDLLQMSLEECRELGWFHRLPPGKIEAAREAWAECLKGVVPWDQEQQIMGPDDTYHSILTRGVPVRNAEGQVTSWVGINLDIDERYRAEEEIRRINEDLAAARDAALQASAAKSRFLANMSHELRTPLNAIIGYAEMLEEEACDAGLKTFVSDLIKIQTAAKHLLALISDILDFSKIEAGRMTLNLEWFDLGSMIEEVKLTTRPLAEKNGNRLVVESSEHPASMYADQTKVRQVLYNLLSNAAKFTENGEITLSVTRSVEAEREWVCFLVEDNGVGIAPEDMRNLFTKFYQANALTSRKKHGGTGLGLALSKQFCEMMGGSIRVDSIPGQGSFFTVKMPVEVSMSSEVRLVP